MDVHQVAQYQEIIRDNMVKYKNALECISSIVENHSLQSPQAILVIREICDTTLYKNIEN